jgi:hypothetical protein
MSDVTIYGASDDLIEVDGDVPGCDEYSGESAELLLTGPEGGVWVMVTYGTNGCWAIGVGPVDEDTRMLPVAIDQQPRMDGAGFGYSARAVVTGVEKIHVESVDGIDCE